MKEEYILLKFSVEEPVYFRLGDYVDIPEGLFEVVDLVFPVYNKTTGGYDYDLRLDAHYWKWKHKILFYDRQKGKEAKWSLTQTPDVHLSIVTSNLASLGYTYKGKPYVFSLDATVEIKTIFIQYDSTNIIDAITEIAKACDCEWWVKENYIFLGRCEDTISSIVSLEIGNELSDMSRSDSTSTYATRIYAFGSDRNIPKNYRPDSDDIVIEGVVQKRLKLPEGIPCIDAYPDMSEEEAIESVLFFDQIYPKRIGTLSDVVKTQGYIVDDNDQPTGETYPIFTIKDAGLKDFKEEYVLNELRLVFQSGRLNGLDFAVELKTSDSTGTTFEIVRNEDYGQYLPNNVLKPSVDDTYILHGYDISFVSDTLIGEAEQELLRETQKYVEKSKIDPSVFTCPADPVRCAGYINDVYHYTDEIDLSIGQRVKLVNPAFFKDGRVSRIYGFEKKLDNKFECTYTVGESTQYSRIGEIENRLDELKYNGNTYVPSGSGGSGVYVIKTNDPTPPTDQNVYSALMTDKKIRNAIYESDKRFLRKDVDDTAHGNILFDQRIGSSVFLEGMEGKGWEIKQSGSALLDSVMIRKNAIIGGRAGSEIFVSGFPSGLGWDLGPYKRFNAADVEETKYRLELDDLIVRGKLRVFEMIISQLRGENDNVIFAGQMKVAFYDAVSGRLYLDTDKGILYNPFRPGDILMVQRFGGLPSAGNNYNVIKQYELRVNEAGVGSLSDGENRLDWITFTNFVGELSDIAVGDVLTRVDSVSDSTRKGIVKVTTIDEIGAPYIDVVYGMKTDPLHSTKVRMGNLSGIRTKNQMDLTGVWGLYAEGAVLENSTFYLDNGMTVEQQFTVMNGELNSKIEGVKNDMSLEQGNILRNSSFSSDTNYWQASNDVHFINVGGSFLWLDGSFYVEKRAVADIYRDGSKNVLRILNTGIRQSNEVMNGDKIAGTYSFSFFYKVLRPGTLSVGIEGTELYLNQSLGESSSYQKMSKAGTWDGTGDFKLQFTGEILIYGVSLFNDALADATIKLQTQIQQNAERISLTATKEYVDSETGSIYQKYDSELKVQADEISQRVTKTEYETGTNTIKREWESKFSVQADRISAVSTEVDGLVSQSSGWITRPQGNTFYASKTLEDGNEIIAYINQTATTTTIKSSKINLQGAVDFSMFDIRTQEILNGKADTDDVTNALRDYVTSSSLTNKLRDYALASTLSDYVKSSYLSSTLASYATNAAADAKAKAEAKAIFNTLTDAMINGKTSVIGGLVSTSILDVDQVFANKIFAKQATIGGFDIQDGEITSNMSSILGNGKMTIAPSGGIYFNATSTIFARMGPSTVSSTSGYRSLLTISNVAQGSLEGVCIHLHIGRSQSSNFPQTWLKCDHLKEGDPYSPYGWGSRFIVQSRYFGDASEMERTVIEVGNLMTSRQLEAMKSGSHQYIPVYYDATTGYLCAKI